MGSGTKGSAFEKNFLVHIKTADVETGAKPDGLDKRDICRHLTCGA